ncbi:MAG: preprotein translocase subunit SecG [Deltaproteobacteria bacterium]|nr:preprotein translocase subunit SecG [Deltaproteobacteria bacterium]MBW1965998.1 preprotein translocase subunit SecG [Deltaproteobacteria bacterium]MBW2097394.1 preprotein translocase subunit SecG [Deltaproteobacteria bacterium]PXF54664.1 MAG: preprotein translocase subunit SecG [Deltaproteobacteria bacterium]RKX57829.1 MAG: preprotein translocase subunit SecG [Thermodesulfobacteriota bacterium]
MYSILIIVYVITCVLLVLTVLLQQGKGAEIGAVFGSSDTIFGSAGPASFLNKLTTGLAVAFMILALVLTYLSAHKVEDSVMRDVQVTTSPVTTEPVETAEPAATVIPEPVETAPAPATGVEEPAHGSNKKTNSLAEDSQQKKNQPENIAPSTNQPDTPK